MTAEPLCMPFNSPLPLCGRPSCIILYRGENCYFCDVAGEMLANAISQYGVPTEVLHEIDIDLEEESDCDIQIVALPTVRICDITLSGLPEEDIINDAIIRVLMKECFSEHSVFHQAVPHINRGEATATGQTNMASTSSQSVARHALRNLVGSIRGFLR